jgi:DnaJ-class molecular chaperone
MWWAAQIKCDDIVTPGSYKKILDEGMPIAKNPFQKGALYIEFDVQFPKPSELDKKTRQVNGCAVPCCAVLCFAECDSDRLRCASGFVEAAARACDADGHFAAGENEQHQTRCARRRV